jgi:hypothetical protein
MKRLLSVLGASFLLSISVTAQATDYVFISANGDTSAASMVQGDTIGFGANLTGAYVVWEVWIDLDGNGSISPGDKNVSDDMPPHYDQDSLATQGLPDMDPNVGIVLFDGMVGGPAAPYTYIFKATDTDSTSATDTAFVNSVPFPGAILSGTVSFSGVTPPDSQLMNILVGAEGTVFNFWEDLTDSFGSYTITLDSFTLGDTAVVSPSDEFPGYTVYPPDTTVIIADSITGLDFLFRPAAAMVSGTVKDDLGADLPNGTFLAARDTLTNQKETTLSSGFYYFNFDTSETGLDWEIEVDDPLRLSPTYLMPPAQTVTVGIGDSTTVNFTAYRTDTFNPGRVTIQDTVPLDKSYLVLAESESLNLGRVVQLADSVTGDFNLYVSSLETSWAVILHVFFTPPPPGYIVEGGWWRYRIPPGDSVNFNMVPITDTLKGNFSYHASVPDSLKFDLSTIGVILSYWSPGGFFDNLADYVNPDTSGNYLFGVDQDTFLVFAPLPDTTFYTIPPFYDSLVVTGNVDTVDFVIYSSLVGVEEEDAQLKIQKAKLLQNQPNPLTSKTRIRFELPVSGHVSLKVYDLSGRLVKTIMDNEMKAGVYTFIWDGSDSDGRKVSSGIYFYRLQSKIGQAGEFTGIRKMILLK